MAAFFKMFDPPQKINKGSRAIGRRIPEFCEQKLGVFPAARYSRAVLKTPYWTNIDFESGGLLDCEDSDGGGVEIDTGFLSSLVSTLKSLKLE